MSIWFVNGHHLAGYRSIQGGMPSRLRFIVMIAADHQRFMDAVAAPKARASSFIASIPQELTDCEDLIGEKILRENSSAKSKLGNGMVSFDGAKSAYLAALA